MDDEMNGRKKVLDKGYYEITYLPTSICIIEVSFYKT